MKANIDTAKGVNSFFNKIEELSKVQRILIFSGVFIAIIAIFVFLLYKPKLAQIQEKCGRFGKISEKDAGSRSAV